MKHSNLENRLINFAVAGINLTDHLPQSFAASHLSRQLIRSSTSTALNYGEAQASESRADFIHKMKVVLKELKESFVCLKILTEMGYFEKNRINPILQECNELVAIFITSLKTVQQKKTPHLA